MIHLTITSGEGDAGTIEPYTGKVTARAIKMMLKRERCGGDRWAYLSVDGRRIADDDISDCCAYIIRRNPRGTE